MRQPHRPRRNGPGIARACPPWMGVIPAHQPLRGIGPPTYVILTMDAVELNCLPVKRTEKCVRNRARQPASDPSMRAWWWRRDGAANGVSATTRLPCPTRSLASCRLWLPRCSVSGFSGRRTPPGTHLAGVGSAEECMPPARLCFWPGWGGGDINTLDRGLAIKVPSAALSAHLWHYPVSYTWELLSTRKWIMPEHVRVWLKHRFRPSPGRSSTGRALQSERSVGSCSEPKTWLF